MSEFDIEKIVDFLKQHKDRIREYDWNLDLKDINGKPFKLLKTDTFEKAIEFRKLLSERTSEIYNKKDIDKFKKLALWIVKDWGGIKGVKDSDKLVESVKLFLESGDKKDFNLIASVSKVASFIDPDKYIIYDARIVYTINWILLSIKEDCKFFPANKGRNSKLNAFDMEVLIRLKNINKYSDPEEKIADLDKALFIDKKYAYSKMNKLIKEINSELFPDKPPYYTEMLLFHLATTIVYDEIKQSITISINKKS